MNMFEDIYIQALMSLSFCNMTLTPSSYKFIYISW